MAAFPNEPRLRASTSSGEQSKTTKSGLRRGIFSGFSGPEADVQIRLRADLALWNTGEERGETSKCLVLTVGSSSRLKGWHALPDARVRVVLAYVVFYRRRKHNGLSQEDPVYRNGFVYAGGDWCGSVWYLRKQRRCGTVGYRRVPDVSGWYRRRSGRWWRRQRCATPSCAVIRQARPVS